VIRWLCVLLVGGVVSGFAFLLLSGRYINEGAVLVTVAPGHGLHKGDVFVIGGWAVSMLALLVLALMPARHSVS
jgi:hypothetical protein